MMLRLKPTNKGCPCACHRPWQEVYHAIPCHDPLLTEPPYKTTHLNVPIEEKDAKNNV